VHAEITKRSQIIGEIPAVLFWRAQFPQALRRGDFFPATFRMQKQTQKLLENRALFPFKPFDSLRAAVGVAQGLILPKPSQKMQAFAHVFILR
jgi:hypothetical protein